MIARLRHTIAEIVEQQPTPEGESFSGVSLVTRRNGKLFRRGFGILNKIEQGEGVVDTPVTPFPGIKKTTVSA